jgi:tetratricopeptide (TPR) repeat protein
MNVAEELERTRALREAGDPAEARERCEELLHALPPGTTDEVRADVLWLLADLRSAAEDHDQAAEAYEEVLPLLERLERRAEGAVAANNLAYHHARAGRSDHALRWILDALEKNRRLGEQPALLRAHVNVGFYRLEREEHQEAESAFRIAVQQARAFGDARETGTALLWLARALARQGRADRALLAYTESLPHLVRAGSPLAPEAEAEMTAIASVPGGAR